MILTDHTTIGQIEDFVEALTGKQLIELIDGMEAVIKVAPNLLGEHQKFVLSLAVSEMKRRVIDGNSVMKEAMEERGK